MTNTPEISVIIPVYKGKNTLDRSLFAVCESTGVDFEVIVVLDGPDADCRKIAMRHPVSLLELPQQSGSGTSRNAGAKEAGGRILMFIDADIEVEENTLHRVRNYMNSGNADAIIGAYKPGCPDKAFFSQYKNLHHHFIHLSSEPETETFWTGCGAVHRDLFLEMGGFETESFVRNIADIEFGYRMKNRGLSIHVHPDIQVTHHKAYNLCSLVQSDLFERAIPWTRIMWHHRHFKSRLNAQGYQQLSTTLSYASVLLFAAPISAGVKAGAVAACLFLLFWLNRNWLGFCSRQKGTPFAIKSAVMEFVHYLICGAGAIMGTIAHFRNRDAIKHASIPGIHP